LKEYNNNYEYERKRFAILLDRKNQLQTVSNANYGCFSFESMQSRSILLGIRRIRQNDTCVDTVFPKRRAIYKIIESIIQGTDS